ncbi:DUF2842 domain-containing protein [Afifella sp. IM 167]|uniref:DUF2842 domain-containing protein n=1 Tax=Afifella sp. IM 167 TaxID=2033586 RepID=UPI001CCEE93B|nr:DUF2842 domain-containing protein [Afifella sp. IM 167]MBZ8134558.1 hypothetical protein [Afifella sp. IM 167]
MRQRTRKLLGTLIIVVWVVFYSLTAMTIAAAKLPGTSGLTQLVFFAVAGLVWVLPAMAVIWWMAQPDRR